MKYGQVGGKSKLTVLEQMQMTTMVVECSLCENLS